MKNRFIPILAAKALLSFNTLISMIIKFVEEKMVIFTHHKGEKR